MNRPPPIPRDCALFIDVDGTLLDIAPRPELVEVPAGLAQQLDRLARSRGGALALVSGRPLADLDRLLEPWRGAAAGLHGAERRQADGQLVTPGATPADRAAATELARLRPPFLDLARRLPGIRVEDKGRTVALHYREAPDHGDAVLRSVETLLREGTGALRLIAGKMVVEVQPRHHGKDGAIVAFMSETPFRSRVPVFLGDDTTDEDGFREVNRRGGLSIRVGDPARATEAAFVLPSVAAAREWLG